MPVLSNEYVIVLVVSICLLAALRSFTRYRAAIEGIQDHPGYRTLFGHTGLLGNILPKRKGIVLGSNFAFGRKHQPFEKIGWDIISLVSVFPSVQTVLWLADAAAIKEVTSYRYKWPKPVHQYAVLSFFGNNIVASEGEEWKRYRKIAAPAFSDRNNRLVWDESCRIMLDLFDNVWSDRDEIALDHVVDLTLQIALAIIGVAGFGRKVNWTDDLAIPAGHQMTFKDALHLVSTDVFLKLIVPTWAMGWTARLRRVRLAFEELEKYMVEMIQARKASEKKEERFDLFSSLLEANDDDDISGDEVKLTTGELVGNIFIFQLAGHETTAHTLCFTFALLALYPDEQENLFQHIKKLLPDGRLPTYEEMPLLTYSMAVFYETLRMFPPVPIIPKQSAEDTVITASNASNETKVIAVPKGTGIVIDTPAIHYNPRYWEDPHSFKPARFLGEWPRDAFLPFSAGARACLGRKFFETEGIAVLTMLVLRYKIELMEEPQFSAETFEEKKTRILAARPGLSLTPIRVPLVFKRRH